MDHALKDIMLTQRYIYKLVSIGLEITYALVVGMILLFLDLWERSLFLSTGWNKVQVLNLRSVIKTLFFFFWPPLKFFRISIFSVKINENLFNPLQLTLF